MHSLNEIHQQIVIPARRYRSALWVAIFGVLISLMLFFLVRSWEVKNLQNQFTNRVIAYANAVESTLNRYAGALLFMGDFFDNSAFVTRKEFYGLAGNVLHRFPGIQGLSWNPLVTADEKYEYEHLARLDGYPDFQFTERNETGGLVPVQDRAEYVIVSYIYPLESNRSAFGYDIASNATRLQAINRGFETGKLAATDRITLVQETGKQFGILLLQPIYNRGTELNSVESRMANRRGFMVEVLRIGMAVESALTEFEEEGINLTLYDLSSDAEQSLLYHRPSQMAPEGLAPVPVDNDNSGLYWNRTFHFAERHWHVAFSPTPFYFRNRIQWQSWIALASALLLTALLVFYMIRKIQYTTEIEHRVNSQIETNQRLTKEIGERTAAEAERDKTILRLQKVLEEVQTLRGILPLCSFCKKVRDDKGYWEQVDVYIHKHSLADISHGVCPECMEKHYPEVHRERQNRKKG